MSRVTGKDLLEPFLLDRLIDDDPTGAPEPAKPLSLKEVRQSVRRDLENLLNTRWRCKSWPPNLEELKNSLIDYGIPDFVSSRVQSSQASKTLADVIAACIARFEPRLRDISVEPASESEPLDRTLHFRIKATLCVEPHQDTVTYSSSFEPQSRKFFIEGAAR